MVQLQYQYSVRLFSFFFLILTNCQPSQKSKNRNTNFKQSNTDLQKNGGIIRCQGRLNIFCWPVTPELKSGLFLLFKSVSMLHLFWFDDLTASSLPIHQTLQLLKTYILVLKELQNSFKISFETNETWMNLS